MRIAIGIWLAILIPVAALVFFAGFMLIFWLLVASHSQ